MNKIFTKKRLLFLIIFLIIAFAAMKVNFSTVIGAENQHFTLFQFLGPIAGAFLGSILGIFVVLGAQFTDFLIIGKEFTFINLIRLLPMLFAVYYFANYRKKKNLSKVFMVIIPLTAMILFWIHPVGRQAWPYALYWIIPILAVVLPKKIPAKLFFRSLGATFIAHSIGSIAWLYSVNMSAEQWLAIIPVVAYERILFASGIAVSYITINTLLDKIDDKLKVENVIKIDRRYVLSKKLLKLNL